jgi:hypothetical protein
MVTGFGVFPDAPGASPGPTAVFVELEDALEWGLARFGSDGFRIGYVSLDPVPQVASEAAQGPS